MKIGGVKVRAFHFQQGGGQILAVLFELRAVLAMLPIAPAIQSMMAATRKRPHVGKAPNNRLSQAEQAAHSLRRKKPLDVMQMNDVRFAECSGIKLAAARHPQRKAAHKLVRQIFIKINRLREPREHFGFQRGDLLGFLMKTFPGEETGLKAASQQMAVQTPNATRWRPSKI